MPDHEATVQHAERQFGASLHRARSVRSPWTRPGSNGRHPSSGREVTASNSYESTLHVVEMVERIVQGMFEETANRHSAVADGDAALPRVSGRVRSDVSKAANLEVQL